MFFRLRHDGILRNMNRLRVRLMFILFCALSCKLLVVAQEDDLNVYMMEATVKLQSANSIGTGFMLMRPLKIQNGPKGSISGRIVLITAAHVLEEIPDNEITVVMHSRASTGEWNRHESKLQIRRSGQPLWIKHPSADVAVMYVIPDIMPFQKAPVVELLATDEILQRYQMGPGIELKCLGYPLGRESNGAGFPILRTGDIASYPVLPTTVTKTFLMDFRVFKGNSGGPVYFSQPQFRGGVTFGGRAQFIMGVLDQEAVFPIQSSDPYGASIRQLQLELGVVIHASIVRQAIELLPEPEAAASDAIAVRMRAVVPGTTAAQ